MERNEVQDMTIDSYIAGFPAAIAERLTKIRTVIAEAAPDAVERISYQMPTFWFEGNLVHFAAFKDHIGFFPAPSGIEPFREELIGYSVSKGTIRFPYDQPIPYDLVARITRYRLEENAARAAAKAKKHKP